MDKLTKQQLKQMTLKYSEKIGVKDKIKSIHVRKMKNKIASCSTKGIITFDYKILDMNKESVKNVIIHELLHFRYRNHGKMFKIMLKYYIEHIDD